MQKAILTLFASALIALPASAAEFKRPSSWTEPIPPFRIVANLYYVGTAELTAFLIATSEGNILLDTGLDENVPQVVDNIRALGFETEDVKMILNSHAHFDHAGGFAQMKKLTGAALVLSERDAPLAARGGRDDFAFGDKGAYPPAEADLVVGDGDEVTLGGTTLVAHITPGHTKGCTSWTVKVGEGGKTLDVVFVGSVSFPGYKLVGNEKYPTIIDDYRASFSTLRGLPCDIFLAAHGSFFRLVDKAKRLADGETPSPFIDPDGYTAFVDSFEKAFDAEVARQRAELK